MAGANWIGFEGYEGRLDPSYGGKYAIEGLRFPYVERTRTWDVVRVAGEPQAGVYPRAEFAVLSRGHDMMKKAHEEGAAYRRHFRTCAGVGSCVDVGHPGGARSSMRQALPGPADSGGDGADAAAHEPARAVVPEPPGHIRPIPPAVTRDPSVRPIGSIWDELGSVELAGTRLVSGATTLTVIRGSFAPWRGPRLTMAQDCNKRGGRVLGDQGELSWAEVELVKRFRRAGWDAYWYQSFKCGRERWGPYIWASAVAPQSVMRLQAFAGTGAGHPDVIGWFADEIVAVESKGPRDALRPGQITWLARAQEFGLGPSQLGIFEWVAGS